MLPDRWNWRSEEQNLEKDQKLQVLLSHYNTPSIEYANNRSQQRHRQIIILEAILESKQKHEWMTDRKENGKNTGLQVRHPTA